MRVGEMLMENRSVSFICRLLLCRFANISKCVFFTVKKRSLIYDLIVAYHYRSLRLLLSHMLRVAPVTLRSRDVTIPKIKLTWCCVVTYRHQTFP